jgi:hypothetical protein
VSTETLTVPTGYDTTSGRAGHAAHKLVHFRDGIMRSLLREAELTADLDTMSAGRVIAALLQALEPADRDRRAYQITTIAGQVWGIFAEIGEEKDHALATLRAVCEDAANAVLRDVRDAACICRNATKGTDR